MGFVLVPRLASCVNRTLGSAGRDADSDASVVVKVIALKLTNSKWFSVLETSWGNVEVILDVPGLEPPRVLTVLSIASYYTYAAAPAIALQDGPIQTAAVQTVAQIT